MSHAFGRCLRVHSLLAVTQGVGDAQVGVPSLCNARDQWPKPDLLSVLSLHCGQDFRLSEVTTCIRWRKGSAMCSRVNPSP